MTLTSSITNAVVVMIIVVVIIGLILGLALAGNDLFNPTRSVGKKEQVTEDIRHDRALNTIKEDRERAKNDHLGQKMELELEFLPTRNRILTAAGALALVIVAVGVAILLIKLGDRWSSPVRQVAPLTADQEEAVWKIRAYRDARIQAARANERHFREAFSPETTRQKQPVPDNDRYRQEPILSG